MCQGTPSRLRSRAHRDPAPVAVVASARRGLYDRGLVHEGLDYVLRFTLIISAAVIVLVALTVAIFLYVRRRSRSAD